MFEKNSNVTDKYKLNDKTALTVRNTRIEGERGDIFYRIDVTLKHKLTADNPLTFSSADEIADFVNNIDLEDNQLSLLGKESND